MRKLFNRTAIDSPPNQPLLTLLERCCSIKQVKLVHTQLLLLGFMRYTYITSRLLAMAAVSHYGDMSYAQSLFDRIDLPTIFNWNTIITGYSKSATPQMAFSVYLNMRSSGVPPNMRTFPVLIKTCAGFSSLSQLHAQALKFAMDRDVFVITSLINSYARYDGALGLARRVFDETPNKNIVCWTSLITGYCFHGLVDEAKMFFDEMPERTDVSWSAMVSGYVRNSRFNEAIQLFLELKECSTMKPNQSLLVCVLNACASLGASVEGKWVHSYIDENGFQYGLELGTALVDFYAKCGYIEIAQQVFHKMYHKDVMSWSAMIMGLAINGHSVSALKFFMDMEKIGAKPNSITFIGVLTACSHGGLIVEGCRIFEYMTRYYGISPTIEHYGCMVDLLGRSGKIKEAEQMINSMPIEPDGMIWGALLNGCVMHNHLELGERVGKQLIGLEPQHSGRYVLLANIYATMGRREGVSELRKLMKDRGVTAVSSWSFIEVHEVVHKFVVDDKAHPQSREIYGLLYHLIKALTTSSSKELLPQHCQSLV